jgi:hypothetical protein
MLQACVSHARYVLWCSRTADPWYVEFKAARLLHYHCLAIGAYGLTQAFLQIPRYAQRPHRPAAGEIYAGLLIFAAGSSITPMPTDLGRDCWACSARCCAISAAVMALLSDLTREQHRTKAMAMGLA